MRGSESVDSNRVVIVGGGPAGLTAAYELTRKGIPSIVLEKDQVVGGLAKTIVHDGYRFDIGGHRFFTKIKPVEQMWKEVLGDDFLECRRLSRIYYNGKFFYYPLRMKNALFGLGLWNSILILASYLSARLFSHNENETFEQWVSHQFGHRLYRIFFKTYTEKVWGIPCSEIRADWAAQRIKGLTLLSVVRHALLKKNSFGNNRVVKTLIDSFYYPRFGPGMMWQKVAQIVQSHGSELRLQTEVNAVIWNGKRVQSLEVSFGQKKEVIEGTHFISSMPLSELIQKFKPAAPVEVLQAAANLHYRDFLTVAVIVNSARVFPDNWIYVHDPRVKVGRIQNFKNWSMDMVPDSGKTCLGLEYFCFQNDELWNLSDNDLIELAKQELQTLGLVRSKDVIGGKIVRVPKAYPVYDSTYEEALRIIRRFLSPIGNLQVVGRNGMHKYNNQDHSMATAMLAVRNALGENHDLWAVNADPDYHEEICADEMDDELALLASTQPMVPRRINTPTEAALLKTFARMDKLAFATAMGSVCGMGIFLASLWLILKGGKVIGPNLQLLNQYFFGYSVTLNGAFIGFAHCFFWGFIFGWLFAYLRNLFLGMFLFFVKKKLESSSLKNLLDYI